jgi:hypothetical protein
MRSQTVGHFLQENSMTMQRTVYRSLYALTLFATAAARGYGYGDRQRRSHDRRAYGPVRRASSGRIASVGSQNTPVSARARRIDLPGITLLPELIDMYRTDTG